MFRKVLSAIGLGGGGGGAPSAPPYAPYADGATNQMYNLLFCDDPAAFRPAAGQAPTEWQAALFSEPANVAALQALAHDASQEGRLRYLAYGRLRAAGEAVDAKVLLGVIVEVPLARGLDVLAAFSEGGVRYINQTGKLGVFEGLEQLRPLVQRLFEAAAPVVAGIGPTDEPRRPPPAADHVRLSFLVSDGLNFGEGPMSFMQRDQRAGPIIARAGELLQTVVAIATK